MVTGTSERAGDAAVSVRNLKKGKGSKSSWDDFTRLPYAYREAVTRLIGDWDLMVDMRHGEDYGHYTPFRYPQPKILSMEAKWDRRKTFSTVLKGLNIFQKRVVYQKTPLLRVILGCAPLTHVASGRRYIHPRNAPQGARYPPPGEVSSYPGSPGYIEYGDAPFETYRSNRPDLGLSNPGSYEQNGKFDPILGIARPVRRDSRSRSAPSHQRRRTDSFGENYEYTMKDPEERKSPRPVQESSTDDIIEEEHSRDREQRFSESRKQREKERQKMKELERVERGDRERSEYYVNSDGSNGPIDRRSSSVRTNKYALARRRPTFAPPRRQDTSYSRRSHQPLRLTYRTESSKNGRYQSLSNKNGGREEKAHSTFEGVILDGQVPPSKEDKIHVAEDLLRLWTTAYKIIGEKVRDRILDQGTVSYRRPSPIISPFPQRPGAASATANSITFDIGSEEIRIRDRDRDQNKNRTVLPHGSVSYQLPSSNLSHDEPAPTRTLPRSVTIEEISERDREDQSASEDKSGSEDKPGVGNMDL